jgi:hypothetical protein
MTATELFVPLESIAPEVARRLQPGVKFRVSRRTFTEIAAERLEALKQAVPASAVAQPATRIAADDLRTLRDAALARSQNFELPGE